MDSRAAIIKELRSHLAQVAPMRHPEPPLPSGIYALDAQIGGWPRPGVANIHGRVGSGRLGLVLPALQAHTQSSQTVAIIDPLKWLYPPGLPGVDLQHIMLVRCGSVQSGWAATQLAGCGAVSLVLLLDPPPLSRDAARLVRATEAGQSTTIVLSESPDTSLTASVRLHCAGGGRVRIERGAPSKVTLSLGLGF